jgi:hypothetical protein
MPETTDHSLGPHRSERPQPGDNARPGRQHRVSVVDVAKRAGVSTQTVSRVVNGSPDVRGSTRQRVIAVMDELEYRPNSAARALKRGSFRTIGVITFSLSSLGTMRTLEAIALHAARQDFAITLIPVTPHPGRHPGRILPDGRTGRRRGDRHRGGPPPGCSDRDAASGGEGRRRRFGRR